MRERIAAAAAALCIAATLPCAAQQPGESPLPSPSPSACVPQVLPRQYFSDGKRRLLGALYATSNYLGGGATAPPDAPRPLRLAAPRETLTLFSATTETQRETGLMCITKMDPQAGMLFVFPHDDKLSFWMKDTLIPLDMVFVRENGTVTTISANVPVARPDTVDDLLPRYTGFGRFVIELNAGEAAKAGIRRGSRLRIPR